MEFGLLSAGENGRNRIYTFGGLNRARKGNRYESSDMYNMSAREYPCAAPCGGRIKIAEAQSGINAVCAPDTTNTDNVTGITGVYDGGFYYNGVLKSKKFTLSPEWSWQIEQKGNTYIINGYDKTNTKSLMYYYCIDTDEFEEGGVVLRDLIVTSGTNYLETIYTVKYGVQGYSITTPDGTVISNEDFCDEYLCEYYSSSGGYTMSKESNIFEELFKVGDEVTIEGFPGSGNNGQLWNIQSEAIVAQPNLDASRNNTIDTDNMATTESLSVYGICTVKITGFSIVSKGSSRYAHRVTFEVLNKNGETVDMRDLASNTTGSVYCSGVTLKRRMRVFDNITIHHGRIWGSVPSGNQIYASASDDIFSFSSDDIVNKYAARIPSDTPGTFTALCSFNNDLIAFKKDSITVVSGTNPTNYGYAVIKGIGCIAPKSVAVTPDGVIFLGYNGFYIYNGALPRYISNKLNTSYISAVSGFDGNCYYASSVRNDGICELLVYDMRYGLWHKEDNFEATGFFRLINGFYIADDYALYKANATDPEEWSFTLMRTHDNSLDNKGINEIWVRAEVSDGAEFEIETAVGNREFNKHSTFSKTGLNIYRCPVRLRMGEDYSVKISGRGNVVIYEIEMVKPDGGRRYKEY